MKRAILIIVIIGVFIPISCSIAGTTSVVRGKVTCSTSGELLDGAKVQSSGIGVDISSNGQYIFSELPGTWSVQCSKNGYNSKSRTLRVDGVDENIRLDFDVTCPDNDYDGVCDINDNCPSVPNGPREGVCVCSPLEMNGRKCTQDSHCGTCSNPNGFCDMYQGDWDTNGVGDACQWFPDCCLNNDLDCCMDNYWE